MKCQIAHTRQIKVTVGRRDQIYRVPREMG